MGAGELPTHSGHATSMIRLSSPTPSSAPSWRPWWQAHCPCLFGRCRLAKGLEWPENVTTPLQSLLDGGRLGRGCWPGRRLWTRPAAPRGGRSRPGGPGQRSAPGERDVTALARELQAAMWPVGPFPTRLRSQARTYPSPYLERSPIRRAEQAHRLTRRLPVPEPSLAPVRQSGYELGADDALATGWPPPWTWCWPTGPARPGPELACPPSWPKPPEFNQTTGTTARASP